MKKQVLLLLSIAIGLILPNCKKKNPDLFVIDDKVDFSGKQVLSPEIIWKFGHIVEYAIAPTNDYAICVIQHHNLKQNRSIRLLYLLNLNEPIGENRLTRLTDLDNSSWNAEWAKDGKRVRFLHLGKNNKIQIWEYHLANKKLTQLTKEDNDIEHFKFSPDNTKVLYTQRVQISPSTASVYPDLPKAKVRIIEDLMYRHWDTWENGSYSHIFVASVSNYNQIKDVRDINAGEAFHTPMSPNFNYQDVVWSPTNKHIYYSSKKLQGIEAAISTNSDIYCYDLDRNVTTNLTEKSLGYDTHPLPSSDGKQLAWLSMATPGYESDKNRLMILNIETREVIEASKTIDNGVSKMIWQKNNKGLFLISGIDATYQVFEYVDAEQPIRQVTKGWHTYHDIALHHDGLIGKKTSMTMAAELYKIDPKTGQESPITQVNQHLYKNLEFGKVLSSKIYTHDWKEMQVWIIFPPDFDSTKTYPALLYCQGGPQQAITPVWGNRWNFQLIAAQGFIVIAPNRRGTPTFGSEWLKQISGDYSGKNIQDYLSAADMAAKLPYVDKNRIGALGASYGGYSVFYLAGTHKKRFKAFMAHCGMFNMESFYGTTEELFFPNHDLGGPYWDKTNHIAQRSYANSPHKFVQNWDTPILITVGEHDYRVSHTEGLQAFTAAKEKGLPAKLLFFPQETHFVAQPQNAVLWHRETFQWFKTHLK